MSKIISAGCDNQLVWWTEIVDAEWENGRLFDRYSACIYFMWGLRRMAFDWRQRPWAMTVD